MLFFLLSVIDVQGAPATLSSPKQLPRLFFGVILVMTIAVGSIALYFLYPFSPNSSRQVGEGRAAIVDGLSELNPNPGFEETATRYLSEAGMLVDVYKSAQFTVGFMKSFPAGYALVIFRVHSATSRDGVFYFTSELYDESKYQPEQYRDELRPGKDYEGHPTVFAFGAKFVEAYLQDRFRRTIVVGMGCFGAGTSRGTEEEVVIENVSVEKGPILADAFYRQGATALIGWDVLVTLGFSDQATLRLIKALAVGRLTVREATERVNLEVGPDPTYKSRLTYYPEKNGDKTLLIQPRNSQVGTQGALSVPWIIVWAQKAILLLQASPGLYETEKASVSSCTALFERPGQTSRQLL